jgi:large conductance mechanosensitive channel
MIQEFKAFALRGNVVDMAVGVVIGASFGKIVSALVDSVFMPAIGVIVGGINFSDLKLVIQKAADKAPEVAIGYGAFIQTVFDFTIVAFVLFMVIKGMNRLKKNEEVAPAAPATPPRQELLLEEIRDLLKKTA